MPKDNAYLKDIPDAAKAIRRFTDGCSREQFKPNEEKCEAVNRKLEILGEASRHLSHDARTTFPEVPRTLITAMRNILIHNYADVDLDVVWDTVQQDLPPLIGRLEPHLEAHPPEAD